MICMALAIFTGCSQLNKGAKVIKSIPSKASETTKDIWSTSTKAGKAIWGFPPKAGKAILGFPSKVGKAIWGFPSKAGKAARRFPSKSSETIRGLPSTVSETVKVIWGSSTKALENARDEALTKTYQCSFNDCYDAVLALGRAKRIYRNYRQESQERDDEDSEDGDNEDSEDGDNKNKEKAVDVPIAGGYFYVFINDRAKRHIVVMGIDGNVDTTEAGIFFSQPTLTTIKLEISSLSSNAKRKVADIVFNELASRFSALE